MLLLFDLDGTLLAPRDPLHTRAFNETLAELCGFTGSIDWAGTSGLVDRAILARLMERAGMASAMARRQLTTACRLMASSYSRGPFDATTDRALPGVRPLLQRLHAFNVPMGLLTGNVGSIAWGRVQQAGLAHMFLAGAFGDEAMRRATLIPRAIKRCSRAAGRAFRLDEVTVIGDTPRDIDAAHRSGVRCVAVATGDYTAEALATHGPDAMLPDLTDTEIALRVLLQRPEHVTPAR